MSKRVIFIWVILVLLGVFYIKWTEKALLRITMCDIGQGDAFIISYKHYQVVIDGGGNRRILECLGNVMPIFDKTIEVVVATHPDKDHIGGLQYVLNRYKVDQIITNGQEKQTTTYNSFAEAIKNRATPEKVVKKGDTFGYEDVMFLVLWPDVEEPKTPLGGSGKNIEESVQNATSHSANNDDANASSIALRLEFGGFSALLTGDLEMNQEDALLSSGELLPATLLKVGHHGSKHSTSPAFIEAIRPSMAFIGVGKNNTYGHPTKRVLDLLEVNQVKLYRSDLDGQVDLKTDGKSIWKI